MIRFSRAAMLPASRIACSDAVGDCSASYLLECSLHAPCCTEGGPQVLELIKLRQLQTQGAGTGCAENTMVCFFTHK